jgi:hypothetical protein
MARILLATVATLLACHTAAAPSDAADPAALVTVDPARMCVESGAIESTHDGHMIVRAAGMRAVARNTNGSAAEIAFTYRGPTRDEVPLASGEMRRQIGLKLRAKNTCNVAYVTWHIAPTVGIHVSAKSNPGKSTHAECGDRGYVNVAANWKRDVTPIQAGERRTLTARIDGKTLRVATDGILAWEGTLPDAAFEFDGPVGVRSDNGEFDFELHAATGTGVCPH